ncbi:hypothetical protein CVV38_04245 [Candidatus Peregrinibacteria bacterium HGW-Peregrinibacteria-1]|nr:MAG: hypothetical protein CVV38_04245 [Candidatus Peregrinibacteria bacterium HGW-Peregrinibacteria-1]
MKKLQKKGFTLIELLVVIAIMGVLVVLGIGGYNSYRQSAMLSLSIDDFGSQIKEMQEKTFLGDLGRGGDLEDRAVAKCYGVLYREDLGFFSVEMDYVSLRKWDPVIRDFKVNGCDEVNLVETKMFGDDKFKVLSVTGERSGELKEFMIYFEPPGGVRKYDQVLADEKLEVIFYYGDSFSDNFSKSFYLN